MGCGVPFEGNIGDPCGPLIYRHRSLGSQGEACGLRGLSFP